MIGLQNQRDVQHVRVELIRHFAFEHVEKVSGDIQIGPRFDWLFTVPGAVDCRHDCRKLSGQAGSNSDVGVAREVASLFVEKRQGGYRRTQRIHWLGVFREIFDRAANPLWDFVRRADIRFEFIQLRLLWQSSIPEQEHNLFKS